MQFFECVSVLVLNHVYMYCPVMAVHGRW
jgi:hypothetical protein